MGSPLDSAVGVAIQAAKGSAQTIANKFRYALFERSTISPIEIVRPFPRLAGSSRALPRGSVKTGVYSGGDMDMLLGPEIMGFFLYGIMGETSGPTASGAQSIHQFTLPVDEFSAPYLTIRRRVAGLWHEQFQDGRITGLTITAPAADMVRFNVAMAALNPQMVANTDWAIGTHIDDGDPFLTCVGELGFDWGSYCARNITLAQAINLAVDEEWCINSYYPYDLSIGGRIFTIQCDIRADATLFGQLQYDPEYTGTPPATWTPGVLSGGSFMARFETQADDPSWLQVEFDSVNDNIDWTVTPVGVRAADNVQTMRMTGIVKQSAGTQILWKLRTTEDDKYDSDYAH